jgi:hypothetical protein
LGHNELALASYCRSIAGAAGRQSEIGSATPFRIAHNAAWARWVPEKAAVNPVGFGMQKAHTGKRQCGLFVTRLRLVARTLDLARLFAFLQGGFFQVRFLFAAP